MQTLPEQKHSTQEREESAVEPRIHGITCHLCQVGQGFRLLPHVHEDRHEIYLVTQGRACAHVGEERHEGHVGDVLYHPRGKTHFPEEVGGGPLQFLHLRWAGGDSLMRAWTSNPVHDQNGHIRHLLEWLVDLDHHPAPSDGPLRRGLVESVVREGLRLQHAPHSQLVQSVSRFVRENLADKLALEDLARYAHMSKYYFSRRFRKECGRSPMQYVAEMRIQAAKQMLLRTDMTIAAIAVAVGLRDGPHFSHVFKRYTGYTPGAFRANR